MTKLDTISIDRSPHASLGNDEADQAGPFFSTAHIPRIDEGEVFKLLGVFGYYRFRTYWLVFSEKARPSETPSFVGIVEAMRFDEELANLILRLIAPVEIAFRSALEESLTNFAGEKALESKTLFTNAAFYDQMKAVLEKEYKRANRSGSGPLPREVKTLSKPPSWRLIEVSSLGAISKMYSNLSCKEVKKDVARVFCTKPYLLENWMRCLTALRNACAHNELLYGRTFNIRPALYKEHAAIDNTKLFCYLIPLMKLHRAVRPNEAHEAGLRLRRIVEAHPDVDLSRLGFPKDWKTILGIPTSAAAGPRTRGTNGGRPPKDPAAIEEALYLYDLKTYSIAEISRKTGVGPTTLYKYIKLRKS